jgi:signal transduction histidine kinase
MFSHFIRYLLLLHVLGSGAILPAQQSDIFSSLAYDGLYREVDSLIYLSQYEKAHALINAQYDRADLSSIEGFEYNYLLADVYRSSGQEAIAIGYYRLAEKMIKEVDAAHSYLQLINLRMAESYFNQSYYDEAKHYALKATKEGDLDKLAQDKKAVVMLILGYWDYLNSAYESALNYYQLAEEAYLSQSLHCDLPLVHLKMASIYYHLGNNEAMNRHLDRSVALIDSCGIAVYKGQYYTTKIDIYKLDGQYRKALELQEELSTLNTQIAYEKQRETMREVEAMYNDRILEVETQGLRELNEANKALLQKQRLALYISLLALALLTILIVFLVRSFRQMEKARQKISEFNLLLEAKVRERTLELEDANITIERDAAQLKVKNAQMLDFCNIISHNFRAPLSNMTMLIKLIESSKEVDEQRQFMKSFSPVVDHLNQTCSELMESLQVAQRKDVEIQYVEIEPIFKKVQNSLLIEIEASGSKLDFDFSAAPKVTCNPAYLESILYNLFSNAMKYRSPQRIPEIHITTTLGDHGTLLTVGDNGLGLDLKKHGKDLFKISKIFHEHPDAKGFGLYMTKVHVEAVGGKIWAESVPGEGSTFHVQFAP